MTKRGRAEMEDCRMIESPKLTLNPSLKSLIQHGNQNNFENLTETKSMAFMLNSPTTIAGNRRQFWAKSSSHRKSEVAPPPISDLKHVSSSTVETMKGTSDTILGQGAEFSHSRLHKRAKVMHVSGDGGSSSQGGGSQHVEAGSSSSGSEKRTFADMARGCQGTKMESSLPQPPQIRVPGIRLPYQPLPQYEYRISIGLAKTFKGVYGMDTQCEQMISLQDCYIHWLAVNPEAGSIQMAYDSKIPPIGSRLDGQMTKRWASFWERVVEKWRLSRWNRHGIKNPIYEQELYFHNACSIHEFLGIKEKLDLIATKHGFHRFPYGRDDTKFREATAEFLVDELTKLVGCRPQLKCRPIANRPCVFEWIWKLNSSLELVSFSETEWNGGGFKDNDKVLF